MVRVSGARVRISVLVHFVLASISEQRLSIRRAHGRRKGSVRVHALCHDTWHLTAVSPPPHTHTHNGIPAHNEDMHPMY